MEDIFKKLRMSLGWFFGVLFLLLAVTYNINDLPGAIIMLIMSAVLIPPSINFIEEKSKIKFKILYKSLFIFFGIIMFGTFAGNTDKTIEQVPVKQNQIEQPITQKEQSKKENIEIIKIAKYEILKTEDQSHKAMGDKLLSQFTTSELVNLPEDKKMMYRVVLPSDIKENQVRPTCDAIIKELTTDNNEIDEISLLLYSDKELVEGAYDIGSVTWAVNGKLGGVTADIAENNIRTAYKTTYKIKENLEEYLLQRGKSEDKLGLTEEKRKEIFRAIVKAEDKGRTEADEIYPTGYSDPQENLMKNLDKNRELMDKYRADVRIKYNISEDDEGKIVSEGITENWSY